MIQINSMNRNKINKFDSVNKGNMYLTNKASIKASIRSSLYSICLIVTQLLNITRFTINYTIHAYVLY